MVKRDNVQTGEQSRPRPALSWSLAESDACCAAVPDVR
jgi:hypothetical protein